MYSKVTGNIYFCNNTNLDLFYHCADSIRAKLLTSLTDLCREYKVTRASECSGHHSVPFKQFLKVLSRIYYSSSDDKDNISHKYDAILNSSFTPESWV